MPKQVKILAIALVVALALASAVDAKLNVTSLSAITADLGTVNSGVLNGVVINGGSIDIGAGQFTVSNAGILYLGGPTVVDATLSVDNLEVTPMAGGGTRAVCVTDGGFLFAAASC